MNVSMIGCGKLGLPCAEVMASKYKVVGFDPNGFESDLVEKKDSLREAIIGSDIIFVAAPTPHDERYGGEVPTSHLEPRDFDYSVVEQILSDIAPHVKPSQLVVLISTVLPGTTRSRLVGRLGGARFIYNPYLIAMGSVKWDMQNPECLIIGTCTGAPDADSELITNFYKPLMQNNPRINLGTWDEAECIKIFYNTYISLKVSYVNMIQDVAQKNGNINVDVVTDAIKAATLRLTSGKYLTAGMGDAGPCHPRDNIALSWIAQELDLGYDLFKSIMETREAQARNMAKFIAKTAKERNLPIVIHGKAYKPQVPYINGSYSLLVGHYLGEEGIPPKYVDPMTGDMPVIDTPHVILLAHSSRVTYEGTGISASELDLYCDFPQGSVIVDPWRRFPKADGLTVIHYGNTRPSAN